jgi:radical SAM protein with 4Fe4S-binding SPASM domain
MLGQNLWPHRPQLRFVKDINKMQIASRYIPINKGHFELETDDRQKMFKQRLSEGWEDDYKSYRQQWTELPISREVRPYPLLVDLEMASKCNLKCPMCPTITEEFRLLRRDTHQSGLMSMDLVKRIIDEVHPHIYSLRLSWVGEPTLHPTLVDAVRYGKSKGIKEISFLTNGSRLHLGYMEKLIDAGLDLMTVSIDGMDDEYDRIRAPLTFKKTLSKLKKLKAYKDQKGIVKPLIKIQGVWPAIRPNPETYYNLFAPLVDVIAFNPLIDYLHKDQDIIYEDNFSCPQPYQRITVAADGRVAMCSNDDLVSNVLGDATKESISEIWHGDKMRRVRELHSKINGFIEIEACRNCYYPRKIEKTESTLINGRKFVIENYVNRRQEVGL